MKNYQDEHDDIEEKKQKYAKVSPSKAKTILRHGEVKGHELSPAQKRFFGWEAGGEKRGQ